MSKEFNEEYVKIAMKASKQVSWKFAKGNYQLYEEYFSEALVGATKALNTFDESKGFTFITYCGRCVTNEIQMFLRKKKSRICNTVSMSEKIPDNEDICIEDMIEDMKLSVEDEIIFNDLEGNMIDFVDKKFSRIERETFKLKYKNPELTQKEIANELGVSQSYISRVIKKNENNIKYYLRSKGFNNIK